MIGIRAFRNDLAAHVRRAANGEPTIISVDGRPAAALVPVTDHRPGMSEQASTGAQRSSLIASGALVPPRRADGAVPERTVPAWGNVRLDRLLREVRG